MNQQINNNYSNGVKVMESMAMQILFKIYGVHVD